jgi:DNA-directed RNA polymerase specialized sigma24 family protein
MPIPDEEAVLDLFAKVEEDLRTPIEVHIRKLGESPDPQAVRDITFDACETYLGKPAEKRDDDAPLLHLVRVARDCAIKRYRRRSDSPNRKVGGGLSLDGAADEALNKDPEDPADHLATAIDLERALEALKKERPREYVAIIGWLADKDHDQLEQELKTNRDGVNNLIRGAKKFIRDHMNGATGKEK